MNTLVHINYSGFGKINVIRNGKWKVLQSVSMGTRDAFSEYSAMHQLVLFGGGRGKGGKPDNREIYALDKSGKIDKKGDAPLGFGTHLTIVTQDPVSGRFLVFANGKVSYEYNVTDDSWRKLDIDVPFLAISHVANKEVVGTVAAPIATHGVVMFLQYLKSSSGGSKVWLYKHQVPGAESSP